MPLQAKNRAGLSKGTKEYNTSGKSNPSTTAVLTNQIRCEWYERPGNNKDLIELMGVNVAREYGFARVAIRSNIHANTDRGRTPDAEHVTIDFQKRDDKKWTTGHVYVTVTEDETNGIKTYHGFDASKGERRNPTFWGETALPNFTGTMIGSWVSYNV